ncbi:MAG: glycerophosphodiester phosphodiesterase [Vagococcus sp.]
MTLIFAHRGSKGTHPENTLAAFKEACRVKSDGIELDVQLSKDGELIVIHDEDVSRTTNGTGEIKDLTLKQIKELDAGSWFEPSFSSEKIPVFKEVLNLLIEENYKGMLNIELKTDKFDYPGIEKKVIDCLLERVLPGSYMFSSFNMETLKRMQELDQQTLKAIILDSSAKKISFAKETEFIEGMHPSIKWVKGHTEDVATFNKHIRPWTVNSDEDIQHAFESDLTAIHTDFPEKALALREMM